jgi:Winged helix-turn-helix DNA-binding
MTREELIALRDAIDITLALPDSVREMLVKMLTPETAKPNGHDRHPPASASIISASPPRAMKTQFIANPAQVQAAEKRLLAALRANPGASIHALAKAAGANRSSTGERLRRLAAHGVTGKDAAGRWKVKDEEPRPEPMEGPTERPTPPPSN